RSHNYLVILISFIRRLLNFHILIQTHFIYLFYIIIPFRKINITSNKFISHFFYIFINILTNRFQCIIFFFCICEVRPYFFRYLWSNFICCLYIVSLYFRAFYILYIIWIVLFSYHVLH